MEEALPELRRMRGDALLLTWIRALPEDVVRRSPTLSIMAGWEKLMAGDLDGVESWLDDADKRSLRAEFETILAGLRESV